LRDPNNGRYSERILLERFGEQEADRVLRESHVLAFSQWLGYTLEQQKIDLVLYVSALRDNKRTVLRTWLRLEPYRNLIPESAGEEERKLYLCDLETVLQLLNAQFEPESCPARILVVDDNPMILGLFTRILEQAGYLVTAVNGGAEALREARLQSFEIMITDLKMPDMSGEELVRLAQAEYPNLKIVVTSGFIPDELHQIRGVEVMDKIKAPRLLLPTVCRLLDPWAE
jgi:CheY-like chemotaxis protein